ncbi:MAG: hypothetical protein ACI9S9_004864, partial [Planctomycetota bacterium]
MWSTHCSGRLLPAERSTPLPSTPPHPISVKYTSLLATGLTLAVCSTLSAQYRFTQQVGLITGPTVRSEGCILADIDGDGDLDAIFANGYVLSINGQSIRPTILINKINQGLGFVDESTPRIPTTAIRGT